MTLDLSTDKNQTHPLEPAQNNQKQLFPTEEMNNEKAEENKCSDTSAKNKELKELCDRLWTSADELRANSALRSTQYSTPILGLIFLRYADHKFEEATQKLQKESANPNKPVRKLDYQAEGVVYLTEKSRYAYLLNLPEEAPIGKVIDDAMRSIENENEDLKDVLPKNYVGIGDKVLVNLIKLFHKIPTELDQDLFGKIYEYFLGEFAKAEGQGSGEFYTPTSIVRLIVEVIEPYHGRILDPACGSGGMFVQSAEFVKGHLKNPYKEISIYGQEKTDDIVRLCKMNLAVHGLSGDIKQANTYYEDSFNMKGKFDFVMANPPFNVDKVDKEIIKDDPRYSLGLPTADNANYLWVQIFYSMLKEGGIAGFVMPNIACDSGYSEREIRKKLVNNKAIDVVISVASDFFYSVALPVTLWFLKKHNSDDCRKESILFIDARKIFNQIDRRHREFTAQQIEFISNIVRLHREKEIETMHCSKNMVEKNFPNFKYRDINGLCKSVSIDQVEQQGWSLNPGRYVGSISLKEETGDFTETIQSLFSELELLDNKSQEFDKTVMDFMQKILGES